MKSDSKKGLNHKRIKTHEQTYPIKGLDHNKIKAHDRSRKVTNKHFQCHIRRALNHPKSIRVDYNQN